MTAETPTAEMVEAAVVRLRAFAESGDVQEAYHAFRSPMHTMAGDVRHMLATLTRYRDASSTDAVAAAIERCARIAEDCGDTILVFHARPDGPPGNSEQPITGADIAALIRSQQDTL